MAQIDVKACAHMIAKNNGLLRNKVHWY
jgi:hypothetical protein